MKAYIKYLNEFEKLFDLNVETQMDQKLIKLIQKKSQHESGYAYLPVSRENTDVETNLVRILPYLILYYLIFKVL